MLKISNVPDLESASIDFEIKVGGIEAFAYKARVSAMPINQVWPGYQRPLEQTELASFISFDTDSETEIEVTPKRDFNEAVIRPLSKKIIPKRIGNTLKFKACPGDMLSLELDGFRKNLHIFANKPICLPSGDDVVYFGAGSHEIGQFFAKDNQTIVIDSGAIVYGSIIVKDAKNVKICGHGILCNSVQNRLGLIFPHSHIDSETLVLPDNLQAATEHPDAVKAQYSGCMKIISSENVFVEGITFRDSSEWTAIVANSINVNFNNVKLIGMWRYNADGIDYCNSKNGSIKNSFLRNFDDNIVIKGLKPYDNGMMTENLYFEKNVIWCDWGRCLEIGAETCSNEMKNFIFRDIDIIHGTFAHMDVQNGDRGDVHDILFENIRCEYSKYEQVPVYQSYEGQKYRPEKPYNMPDIFASSVIDCYWSKDKTRGKTHDITLRDIFVTTDVGQPYPKIRLSGLDELHNTENITIENLYINGKKITNPDNVLIKGDFVNNVNIK